MIKRFLHARIAKLERALDYDAAYAHEILDTSLAAFLKFGAFQAMSSHREGVPAGAKYAAALAATIAEDCGPCTQTIVNFALKSGVSKEVISALLKRDFDAAGAHASLGFRLGDAIARRTDGLDDLVAEARERYGKRGLTTLAFSAASARVYPALKRGLGHAEACARVKVGSEDVWVSRAA